MNNFPKPVIKLEPITFDYPLPAPSFPLREAVQSLCVKSESSPPADMCYTPPHLVKRDSFNTPPRPVINISMFALPTFGSPQSPESTPSLPSPPPVHRTSPLISPPSSTVPSRSHSPSSPIVPSTPIVPSAIRIKQHPEPIFHYLPNTPTSWQTIASLNYVSSAQLPKPTVTILHKPAPVITQELPVIPQVPEAPLLDNPLISMLLKLKQLSNSSTDYPAPTHHLNGSSSISQQKSKTASELTLDLVKSLLNSNLPTPSAAAAPLLPTNLQRPSSTTTASLVREYQHTTKHTLPVAQSYGNSSLDVLLPSSTNTGPTKRHRFNMNGRWTPTPRQVEYLKNLFNYNPFYKSGDASVEDFCKSQNIPFSRAKTWFQNERARKKREEKMRSKIRNAAQTGNEEL